MKQLTRAIPYLAAALALFALSAIPALAAELTPADAPVKPLEVMLAAEEAEGGECTVDADVDDTEAGADCPTQAAAAGDPLCAGGGTKCKNPGASCKLLNGCGICRNKTASNGGLTYCTGCTCFPF